MTPMVLLSGTIDWPTTTIIDRDHRLIASTSITWDLEPCIETVDVFRVCDGHRVGRWSRCLPRWGRPGSTWGLIAGRSRASRVIGPGVDLNNVLDAIAEQTDREAARACC